MIRQPIITVLGHVDAGKTSFLDIVRGTAVAAGEAGAITQHIGATEVPIDIIRNISGKQIEKYGFKLTIPGLLFIDTPGHAAFTHLRERGGSIADLAVVIVDIMKGFQEQTYEAIRILKTFKTPFIVVANKIDNIAAYSSRNESFTENIANQPEHAQQELDNKVYEIVMQLHNAGFESERFDRCKDFTKCIPIIPASVKTGEGIAEILMFLAGLSQKFMEQRLTIQVKGAGRGSVLEVKEEKGLGKTIDIILYDGMMSLQNRIVLGGRQGVIVTKVRALLKPKPLEEMRQTREKFLAVTEVFAASGIKIAAPELNDAIAGSPIFVVENDETIEELKRELKEIEFDSDALGPIIRADTLGSLEAMEKILKGEGLKIKKADLGDVTRKDIMEAATVKEKDAGKAVVFAFNVDILPEALEEAKKRDIKIFSGDIIYKLLESYKEWVEGAREKERGERCAKLVFPVEFKILPNFVFRHSKPAIVGVRVIRGRLKAGIEVMKGGKIVGKIEVLQSGGKAVNEARENEEVAASIEGATVGRQIMENDVLCSFIPKKCFSAIEQNSDLFSQSELELAEKLKEIEKNMEEKE